MRQAFGFFKKEQKAYTGLESAIILATFVMVAAIFAHTVLNTGVSASTASSNDKATVDNEVRNTQNCTQANKNMICQNVSNVSKTTEQVNSSFKFMGDNTSIKQNNQINQISSGFGRKVLTLKISNYSPVAIGSDNKKGL